MSLDYRYLERCTPMDLNYLSADAVRRNDIESILRILDTGGDINGVSYEEGIAVPIPYTMLEIAAKLGYLEICECLLDLGADINFQNDFGKTAIHSAVLGGSIPVIEFLLDMGANPNLQTQLRSSAIGIAIGNKNLLIADILLKNGADINILGEDDFSLLHRAITIPSFSVCKFLIERGIRLDIRETWGNRTVLELAMALSTHDLYQHRRTQYIKIYNFIQEHANNINRKRV